MIAEDQRTFIEGLGATIAAAALGLLALIVFSASFGSFWAYLHPERDLWGIPLLSRDNHVNTDIRAVLAITLLPVGMLVASALIGRALRVSSRRSWLAAIFALPLALPAALLMDEPELVLLLFPLLVNCFALTGQRGPRWLALIFASYTVIALVVIEVRTDYGQDVTIPLFGIVGWVVLPALPVITGWRGESHTALQALIQGQVWHRLVALGLSVALASIVSSSMVALYFDPPSGLFSLCGDYVHPEFTAEGPSRLVSGPSERENLDSGSHTVSYEITGSTPVAIRYANDRPGGGMLCGEKPIDHAGWVVIEPPGTRVELTFSAGIDPRRLRLKIDRDGDGSVDERRPPDDHARRDGYLGEWIEPETFARISECGASCERIELSTEPDRAFHRAGERSYFTIYPHDLNVQAYQGPIQFVRPALVVFWTVGDTGKIGPISTLSVLGGLAQNIVTDINVGDPPYHVKLQQPGQHATFTLRTVAGEPVGLRISEIEKTTDVDFEAKVEIRDDSTGDLIVEFELRSPGRAFDFQPDRSGSYSVQIMPLGIATGELDFEVLTPGADAVRLDPFSGPHDLRTVVPGESRYVLFDVLAGTTVDLFVSYVFIEDGHSRDWAYMVHGPDGSVVTPDPGTRATVGRVVSFVAQQTGAYTVKISPQDAYSTQPDSYGRLTIELRINEAP